MGYELTPVTGAGEIQAGNHLLYLYKGNPEIKKVEQVLFSGTSKEEIILDIENNKYFILSMFTSGESWVKEVCIVDISD